MRKIKYRLCLCNKCNYLVYENWVVRHNKSGCKIAKAKVDKHLKRPIRLATQEEMIVDLNQDVLDLQSKLREYRGALVGLVKASDNLLLNVHIDEKYGRNKTCKYILQIELEIATAILNQDQSGTARTEGGAHES